MSIESRLQQLENDVSVLASSSQDILSAIENKTGQDISYIFPLKTASGVGRSSSSGGGKRARSYGDEVSSSSLSSRLDTLSSQVNNLGPLIEAEVAQNPQIMGDAVVTALNEAVNQLSAYYTGSQVNTEISNQVAIVSSSITANLNNEITNRINADNTLTTNLNNEITNRTNLTNTINTNIATLQNDLLLEITNRDLAIDTETTARTAEDTNLQIQITNLNTEINTNNAPNKLVRLDNNGDLPSGLVQSSVQEVLEYADATEMNNETNKTTNKLYITKDNNKLFRWSGTAFIELTSTQSVVSVNTKSGAVVLNPDDLDDTLTAHKFVNVNQLNDINNIDTLSSQITNNINDIITANTNIINLQNSVLTKFTTPSLINNAGKILTVNQAETALILENPTVPADELPPYTISDAEFALFVNATGDGLEWKAPTTTQQTTPEYTPDEWIRIPTNNAGFSYTSDTVNGVAILENGIQNIFYESAWYDNNSVNNYFETTTTTTQKYVSFKTVSDRIGQDQGFVIYITEDGNHLDTASAYSNTISGRVMVLATGGTNSAILFDGDFGVGGNGQASTGSATSNATFNSYINTTTEGANRIMANITFSVALDNTTKTIHSFWHDGNNLLKTFSTYYGDDTINNKAKLRLIVKMSHYTADITSEKTQKLAILSASQAPTFGITSLGFTYLYNAGTGGGGGGGISLPINQSDVVGLVSALASKFVAPTPLLSNQYLKVNSGATGFEYGVPSGSVPTIDNTTSGKYLYNNGSTASWNEVVIPASLPILNLPSNSIPAPNQWFVSSNGTNYVWIESPLLSLTLNFLTVSEAVSTYYNKTHINDNFFTKNETTTQINNAISNYSPFPSTSGQNDKYLKFDGVNIIWSPALSAYLDILPFGSSYTDNRIRHISGSDILLYDHNSSLVKIPKKLSLENNPLDKVSKIKFNTNGQGIYSADDSLSMTINNDNTTLNKDLECNTRNLNNALSVKTTILYTDNISSYNGSLNITHATLNNRVNNGNYSNINLTTGDINMENHNLSGVNTINGYSMNSYLNTPNFSGQLINAHSGDFTGTLQCNQLNAVNTSTLTINGINMSNVNQLNNLMNYNIIYDHQYEITSISPAPLGSDPCVLQFDLTPINVNIVRIRSVDVWVKINDPVLGEGEIWKRSQNSDGVFVIYPNDISNVIKIKFYNSNTYGNHACKVKILYSAV